MSKEGRSAFDAAYKVVLANIKGMDIQEVDDIVNTIKSESEKGFSGKMRTFARATPAEKFSLLRDEAIRTEMLPPACIEDNGLSYDDNEQWLSIGFKGRSIYYNSAYEASSDKPETIHDVLEAMYEWYLKQP